MPGLAGKTIVLGVTGGIAAYKTAELCRTLSGAGAVVRVVMTEAATRFITPLTLQTLSGAPVARDLFATDDGTGIGHIRLGDQADLIVVAPATANTIARFAAGLTDDLLTAVVLSSLAPVLLAPAMNVNMWQNPITQQNLSRLVSLGRFRTVGPDAGELACGWVGEGRLIEPAEIAAAAERVLAPQDLAGRRIVVTAGPTFEPIDDVRFIGNRSSGKMGFAIAESAARRGADVVLIAGPVALATPRGGGIQRQDVESTAEMRAALASAAATADVVVMAAAVADFRPATRVPGKMSRRAGRAAAPGLTPARPNALPLLANPDLLAEIARGRRGRRPVLVGFAAEIAGNHSDLVARARQKLIEKGCDLIVANDVGAPGLGFGSDDNAVTLAFADGEVEQLERASKIQIADIIWDRMLGRLSDQLSAGQSHQRSGKLSEALSQQHTHSDRQGRRAAVVRRRASAVRAAGVGATGVRGRRG
jgi:phosphopantothenoylcysteine decarboxylase / phosphopantothenate---cysteine ligase